jgi:exosome complex exonuclease RRP6
MLRPLWLFQKSSSGSSGGLVQLLTAKNIQRPQLRFKDKVNNSNKPFVPIITHKPNALQSLEGQYFIIHKPNTLQSLEG